MTQAERQSVLFSLIQEKTDCTVKELCTLVYASPATVRRDLHTLEQKGLIRLQYGNVSLVTEKDHYFPLFLRSNQEKNAKRAISRYAANMIPAGTTVFLDASSSAMYMADYITADRHLTVFTNGITTATKLSENNVSVHLLGGQLDSIQKCTYGHWTLENISSINAEYLFFSTHTLSDSGIISCVLPPGLQSIKYMIEHSQRQFYLCTSDKLHRTSTYTLCTVKDISGIICDTDLSFIPGARFINITSSKLYEPCDE